MCAEYWFVCPTVRTAKQDVRVKLVDLKHYHVAKARRGWMRMRLRPKAPVQSVWVTLQENRLACYTDSDERDLVGCMDDVDTCDVTVKAPGKKGEQDYTMTVKRKKDKVSLICENDVVCKQKSRVTVCGVARLHLCLCTVASM